MGYGARTMIDLPLEVLPIGSTGVVQQQKEDVRIARTKLFRTRRTSSATNISSEDLPGIQVDDLVVARDHNDLA